MCTPVALHTGELIFIYHALVASLLLSGIQGSEEYEPLVLRDHRACQSCRLHRAIIPSSIGIPTDWSPTRYVVADFGSTRKAHDAQGFNTLRRSDGVSLSRGSGLMTLQCGTVQWMAVSSASRLYVYTCDLIYVHRTSYIDLTQPPYCSPVFAICFKLARPITRSATALSCSDEMSYSQNYV